MNLSNGAHSFRVRAKDTAGNVEAEPASYFWTIEAPPAPTCTPSTVTAPANADAWVLDGSPSSNYGTDSVLKVDSKSGANARALVGFALPQVPAGCQVTGATLRLYSASYKEGRTLQAFRLGGSWTEGGVRWSSQPATTGAAATAPSRSGSDGAGYVQWSVLSQVQAMYSGANNGFLIRDAAESGGGFDQGFNSREKGADNPPQLVISFE
jgi:hypothetical protein